MKIFWHLPEWRKTFLHDSPVPIRPFQDSSPPKPEILVQRDLAKSLKAIAEGGGDAFYKGWIADAIAEEMANNEASSPGRTSPMYEPISRARARELQGLRHRL